MMEERLNSRENGLFLKLGEDLFGICETKEGPRLVFNRDQYDLANSIWDVELVVGRKNNLFIFYWQGELKISLRFDKNQDLLIQLYRMLQEHVVRKRIS